MRLFKRGNKWYAEAKFGEWGARDAGFEWDSNSNLWVTDDPAKAWDLRKYAEPNVKNDIHKTMLKNERGRQSNTNGHIPQEFGACVPDQSRATDAEIDVPAPEGLRYLPYQKAGIAYALKRQNTLIADEMGLGKAQPLTAKILTPFGWKTMGDMKEGMHVIGKDGKATTVTGVFPQGVKDVYEVTFTDGAKVQCCKEHIWTVNTPTRRFRRLPWFDLTTTDLIKRGLKYSSGKRKFHVPVVSPVHFKRQRKPLAVDPWLLGTILAASSHVRAEVGITVQDEAMRWRIEETLKRDYNDLELVPFSKSRPKRWRISQGKTGAGNKLVGQLRKLGIIGRRTDENFIPELYMTSSVFERFELLRGLMDARGTAPGSTGGGLRFRSASNELRKDVAQLVLSLGGLATAEEGRNSMSIQVPTLADVFHNPDKAERSRHRRNPTRTIDRIEKVGQAECQCISVSNSDGLYVTNDFVVTHNTIQAIGVANATKAKRVLVICPASLKLNWKYELKKWLTGGQIIDIATGKYFPSYTPVVIINYDILERHKDKLRAKEFDLLIVDESHYLKNPKAKRTINVLGKQSGRGAMTPIPAKRKLFLSGTPAMNKPVELWPIIEAIAPGKIAKGWYDYVTRYCGAVTTAYGMKTDGASNLHELQKKLRKYFMIRRMKADVLKELPPKVRQVIQLPARRNMSAAVRKEQEEYAHAQRAVNILRIEAETAKVSGDRAAYEEAIKKMRKATGLTLARIAKARTEVAVAKLPDVLDRIKDILSGGAKLVVFAHHLEVIDGVCEALPTGSWVKLDGRDSATKRDQSVRRFQEDETCKVFVGGMKAAGVGLTLTASSHVLFVELDWVPGTLTQAEDRCHRIGQKDSVLVQHMVVEGSIDVNMAKTVIKKQDILERMLDRDTADMEKPDASILQAKSAMRDVSFDELGQYAAGMTDQEAGKWAWRLRKLMDTHPRLLSEVDRMIAHAVLRNGLHTKREGVVAKRLCEEYGASIYESDQEVTA